MSNEIEVKVPDIGDFEEVEVIEVLVGPGDSVAVDDSLITLESDKATMEIPSTHAGVVKSLAVGVGDKVSRGSVIVALDGAAALSREQEPEAAEPAPEARIHETAQAAIVGQPVGGDREATPTPNGATELITVPDIGDFEEVEIIEVLVAAGDTVEREQSLITLESDKATMDIPAPASGTISKVEVAVGDRVSQGSAIAVLEVAGAEPRVEPAPAQAPQTTPTAPPRTPERPVESGRHPHPVPDATPLVAAPPGKSHASPSVRRFARELGVDLSQVAGSGPKGRVLKDDVQLYVKGVMRELPTLAPAAPGLQVAEAPKVDFADFGEVEEIKLSRIKRRGAPHLHRAWVTIPHVTQFDEAEIGPLEQRRKDMAAEAEQRGTRLTPLVFIMKAVVAALREFPQFNASLAEDGEHLVLKRYFNLGVAVDTPDGLVVPVVRGVDAKDVFELAAEVRELAGRARDRKLRPADIQGGCFSVSSLGGIGGTNFTPIINTPEIAILGVARSRMQPVWEPERSEFRPALMLPVALSYDHRVIDGAEAVRFTRFLCELLEDPERLMQT